MIKKILTSFLFSVALSSTVIAAPLTYTVQPGDSMWKIAVKNEVGLSELISLNPTLKNPSLIYPGQKIQVPNMTDVKTQEKEVIRLVNIERSKVGLRPLTAHWELSRVARYKSADMANKNYFSHISPTYGSPFFMMENFGMRFSSGGENIAKGQRTPQEVMNGWMNSPGHKANILSANFTHIGVGLARDKNGVPYWTQMFMKPL
ncbi:SafA/ExsA family spore coat assembly protein [Clostridium malenominatum]|uniref:SafA/ExsA family spore coat assembly protein n=1 Tax=Clostridium malenominatum TaxID=1539 RepID=A0ABN1IPQ4_9CLOT